MKTAFVLLAGVFLGGCVSHRPEPRNPPHAPGLTQMVLPVVGAGAGAAIGYNVNGGKGAVIGALAGTVIGAVSGKMIESASNARTDEAAEKAEGKVRVKVMNDYWESHSINGGNAPREGAKEPASTTVMYPAGVYDGIYYGPRELPAPKL